MKIGDILKEETHYICRICKKKVFLEAEIPIWTKVGSYHYHNLCIDHVVEKAETYDRIREIQNKSMSAAVVCDVWHCGKCYGYTAGYLAEKCSHCGTNLRQTGAATCIRSDEII